MTDNEDDTEFHASANQPYNAERRPWWSGLLPVLGLVVVIALVFVAITWTRYST